MWCRLVLITMPLLLASCGGVGLVSFNGPRRQTPLETAAHEGNLAEVKRLLAFGAEATAMGGAYGSPLLAAALGPDNGEVIRELVNAGANPDGRGQEGGVCWFPPLLDAASAGSLENTRALLDAGATVQMPPCARLTPGWLKPSILDLLRSRGLNIYDVDAAGRNELHRALAPPVTPAPDGVEYLISAGVPLNARDAAGKTPLAYWREGRDYERHWFITWLFDRFGGDEEFRRQRENRARVSALLARSGAVL